MNDIDRLAVLETRVGRLEARLDAIETILREHLLKCPGEGPREDPGGV